MVFGNMPHAGSSALGEKPPGTLQLYIPYIQTTEPAVAGISVAVISPDFADNLFASEIQTTGIRVV